MKGHSMFQKRSHHCIVFWDWDFYKHLTATRNPKCIAKTINSHNKLFMHQKYSLFRSQKNEIFVAQLNNYEHPQLHKKKNGIKFTIIFTINNFGGCVLYIYVCIYFIISRCCSRSKFSLPSHSLSRREKKKRHFTAGHSN